MVISTLEMLRKWKRHIDIPSHDLQTVLEVYEVVTVTNELVVIFRMEEVDEILSIVNPQARTSIVIEHLHSSKLTKFRDLVTNIRESMELLG